MSSHSQISRRSRVFDAQSLIAPTFATSRRLSSLGAMLRLRPASSLGAQKVGAQKVGAQTDWRVGLRRRLVITDAIALTIVVFSVQILWFGFTTSDVVFGDTIRLRPLDYTTFSVLLVSAWVLILGIMRTREASILGVGSGEYRLAADATFRLFGLLAIISFLFNVDLARGYILLALPLGLLTLVASRKIMRARLHARRRAGLSLSRVVVVGSRESSDAIVRDLRRSPESGYVVVAVCYPGETVQDAAALDLTADYSGPQGARARSAELPEFPLSKLVFTMDLVGADTVILTSSQELSPQRVRELSWSLEPGRQHLVMAPSLTDVGGPRIHMSPVAGLPLVHVETPKYDGLGRLTKRAFDLVSSLALILILLPVLMLIAVVVRLTSAGPVLFRQERVGLSGGRFTMVKFRSMVVDAEDRLSSVQEAEPTEGNAVLFKMKDDPRVTRVGKFLRRYSLDELPQLFNVLFGHMALVGPRPPLPGEVKVYENHVHRRFLVKPGITGLWQVSGRSNLSWNDSVRLDLFYVENWSVAGDLSILWRTVKAVLRSEGAY